MSRTLFLLSSVTLVLAAAFALAAPPALASPPDTPLPAAIPPLPFADNPDPSLCGIPQPDGRGGVLTGTVTGMAPPAVIWLYDSHLRNRIAGQLYAGTPVDVLLRQENPTLNYYFVRSIGVAPAQSGWVPAPFVTFEPA